MERAVSLEGVVRYVRAHERGVLTGLTLAQWIAGYNAINFATWGRGRVYTLETWIDDAVPFVIPWVFLYSLAFVTCFVPVLLVSDRRFRVVVTAYTLTIVTTLVTFHFFPVMILRPPVQEGTVGGWLLELIRVVDQPFNCFPSLHVSIDFLAAFYAAEVSVAWGVSMWVLALGISVSTLYVKQHYLLDIVSGLVLSALAYKLADLPSVRRWVQGD